MPDNFIVSFDGGNGKIGDEHCNACLLISTKNKDGSLSVLHEYFNKEAIHLWHIIRSTHHDIDGITLLAEK